MSLKLFSQQGGFEVMVEARYLGADLLVTCTGGDKPHIGAVAVAHQRPSLQNPDEMSASANIICLSGHREDELARAASLRLCKGLGCTVTVVAGMHWHRIDKAGIEQVVVNVETLIEQLLDELQLREEGADAET